MHLMLVADGRSPTTLSWIDLVRGFAERITLVSSYPCAPVPGVDELVILPLAFGSAGGRQAGARRNGLVARTLARYRQPLLRLRNLAGMAGLAQAGRTLTEIVRRAQPDLVHALRIPFEGLAAAELPSAVPLALSIWGNDLTFHARSNRWMANRTTAALRRCDALLADARRDLHLAGGLGFPLAQRPSLHVPGNGGIDAPRLRQAAEEGETLLAGLVPEGRPLVVNPRGVRPGSVRNDTFFAAIPTVAREAPQTLFVCPGLAGEPQAEEARRNLGVEQNLLLLPRLAQPALWALFRKAAVLASISQHDGTPNSFLEALTCGCFPVMGDIESLREWILPGVNGLLVPPDSPERLAEALLAALGDGELRENARQWNAGHVLPAVDRADVRGRVENLYRGLAG